MQKLVLPVKTELSLSNAHFIYFFTLIILRLMINVILMPQGSYDHILSLKESLTSVTNRKLLYLVR